MGRAEGHLEWAKSGLLSIIRATGEAQRLTKTRRDRPERPAPGITECTAYALKLWEEVPMDDWVCERCVNDV